MKNLQLLIYCFAVLSCAPIPKGVSTTQVQEWQEKRSGICPIDGQDVFVVSKNKGHQHGTTLEFRSNGTIDDPVILPICSKCKFPLFKSAYGDSEVKSFKTIVKSEAYTRIDARSMPYFYLARLLELSGAPADTLAYAYLKAAWQADDETDSSLAATYREKSLEAFQIGLGGGSQNITLTKMAVELSRRLERFKEADSLINSVSIVGLDKLNRYFFEFEKCLLKNRDKGSHYFSEAKDCR